MYDTPPHIATLHTTNEGHQLLTTTGQHISDDVLAAFFFDLEIGLLTAAAPSTLTSRGGPQTPTTLEHGGSTNHPATNHPDLTLTIDQIPDPGTGKPPLRITLTRPTLLTRTGHTSWQLIATLTHSNGTTTTETTTPQTLTPTTDAIWTIPLTTTPTTLTHITLTLHTRPHMTTHRPPSTLQPPLPARR